MVAHSSSSQGSISVVLRLTAWRVSSGILGMADVLLGTMRPSGPAAIATGVSPATFSQAVTNHRPVRPSSPPTARRAARGPRRPPPGESPGAGRRPPRARPGRASCQRPGPDRGHHVETDVERAGPALDEGVAGEGGLARLVAAQDPAPARLQLGGRLLDGPVVGAHHQHRGRRRPGRPRQSTDPPGTAPAGAPLRSHRCGHGPSVQRPGHHPAYGRSTATQQSWPRAYPGARHRPVE